MTTYPLRYLLESARDGLGVIGEHVAMPHGGASGAHRMKLTAAGRDLFRSATKYRQVNEDITEEAQALTSQMLDTAGVIREYENLYCDSLFDRLVTSKNRLARRVSEVDNKQGRLLARMETEFGTPPPVKGMEITGSRSPAKPILGTLHTIISVKLQDPKAIPGQTYTIEGEEEDKTTGMKVHFKFLGLASEAIKKGLNLEVTITPKDKE